MKIDNYDLVGFEIKFFFKKNEERLKKFYEQLFELQLKTLEQVNCPGICITKFRDKKPGLLKKALKIDLSSVDFPFTPVIPIDYVADYNQLMQMAVNKIGTGSRRGTPGRTLLKRKEIIDLIHIPREPYFILGIKKVSSIYGVPESPVSEERMGFLTAQEGISLGVHCQEIINSGESDGILCCNSHTEYCGNIEPVHIYWNWGELALACNMGYWGCDYSKRKGVICQERF